MINLKTQKLNQHQKLNKQTKTFDRMSSNFEDYMYIRSAV